MENIKQNNTVHHHIDKKMLVSLALCILIPLSAGAASTFGVGIFGYSHLTTPPLTAPNIVFAILSQLFYALAGLSLHIVLTTKTYSSALIGTKRFSAAAWLALIILTLTLPPIMYVARLYLLGFIWTALALSASITLLIANIKINRLSVLLIVPCVMWLMYLIYVNLLITVMN